mmetsp:Transcript_13574/g.31281  ORF Transcript_13574/g.31281 Transcript_13574/m.31281 type:complete len:261 (-) Transcript_13574:393-1175(-)
MERPPSAMTFWVSSIRRTSGCTIIGSAGPLGFLVPLRERIARRSLAYQSAFWKDSSAAAEPWMAVPRREVLMKVNMWLRPLFSSPIKKPSDASKLISQVDDPWQPILSSMRPMLAPFISPREPSALTFFLGTKNKEIPLVPGGALGRRASTQCTMLSVRSWSPQEMKILVPVMLYEPSPLGSALVETRARSEPHCGSVRHMVPVQVPCTKGVKYFSLRDLDPWDKIVLIAPFERPGYMVQVQFAVAAISVENSEREYGKP